MRQLVVFILSYNLSLLIYQIILKDVEIKVLISGY